MKGKFKDLLQDTELPVGDHLWSAVSSQIGAAPVAASSAIAVGIKLAVAVFVAAGIGAGVWLATKETPSQTVAQEPLTPSEQTAISAAATPNVAEQSVIAPRVVKPNASTNKQDQQDAPLNNPVVRMRQDVQDVPAISAMFDVAVKDSGQTQLKAQDPTGISTYHWNFGDGQVSNLAQPAHRYDQSGTYEVALTAEDESGLAITSKQTVDVALPGQIEVMNVITPNQDGQNDVFDPRGLQPEAEITYLLIMTVNGQTIYESKETTTWDGGLPSGEMAPAGTYLYLIRGLDKNKGIIEKTSTLTLIR
jgi:gliding motility-associated-like protein